MGNIKNITFLKDILTIINKNLPTVLTCIGAVGVIGTAATAIELAPKAKHDLEETEIANNRDLTLTEKISITWRYYLPICLIAGSSIVCMSVANNVNLRRYAALSSAYILKDVDFKEYQEKAEKALGKKKSQEVKDEIKEDRLSKFPVNDSLVYNTGNGTTLCYDYYSGRYFRSSVEAIKRAQNYVNERLIREDKITLNDVYDELSLDRIGIGEFLEFDLHYDGTMVFDISTMVASNDEPCIVVTFSPYPSPKNYHY